MQEHYRFVAKHLKKPSKQTYPVRAKVRVYSGPSTWYFAVLPVGLSKKIKGEHGLSARGWGSLKVSVKLGESEWETSIFPDKEAGAYILPLKASIRKAEGIGKGDTIRLEMTIE